MLAGEFRVFPLEFQYFLDLALRKCLIIDLFELLLRLADGLTAHSAELRPLLEELAPFKNRVQLSNTVDLLLLEAGGTRHLLTQKDGRIVRQDWRKAVSI